MDWFNTLSVFITLVVSTLLVNQTSTQFLEDIYSVNITRSDNQNAGDKVSLLVVNSTLCPQQNVINTELSAQCTSTSQGTEQFGQNSCFLECVCNNETGSFVINERKCAEERELRQGCNLVFGLWSWSTGWLWNSETDRFLALYIEDGFGIQGGFNVSTAEYDQCRYTGLSTFEAAGVWSVLTLPTNESFVTFYKWRGYWHFYWIIEDLSQSKRSEIEGKLMKIDIYCESSNEENGIVELAELSSCIVFKITGNISYEYHLTGPRSTAVYPSTAINPAMSTTNIPIQSTSEHIKSSLAIPEPTSSLVIPDITSSSSRNNPVVISSSVIKSSTIISSSPVLIESTVIISSPVIQSSSVIRSTPVVQSSSVFARIPVIQSSSVIKSTPVVKNSPVLNSSPLYESSPVIGANSVVQSSSVINNDPVITNSSVVNSMEQGTQASEPTTNDDQIGLILGIVVAGSAAVVMTIAAIILTVTTICNSHVKRTEIIQNDAISIGLESLDNTLSTHI